MMSEMEDRLAEALSTRAERVVDVGVDATTVASRARSRGRRIAGAVAAIVLAVAVVGGVMWSQLPRSAVPAESSSALPPVSASASASASAWVRPSVPPANGIPYELYTHCGIHELVHQGQWYVREAGVLSDGNGNPPRGWGNPMQSGWIVVEGDTVTFVDRAGHREVFALRPGATEPLQMCS